MRKSAVFIASFLLFSSIGSGAAFAETAVSEKVNPETGIKEGTVVNGVDIGKLSKDELKYIPKAWRDGSEKNPSEHEEETPQPRVARSAAYPNVNSYIDSKNLPTATVAKSYKGFPKFSYRYNKPEGVVAHETANPNSTIDGEIAYMTRNYNNAFVHAFVDSGNVIEIHPTNYGAWGGGYYANQRFIHVELVREATFDKFARSINNYANYLASLLYQYNLPVTSAEGSGSGTLWSHNAVSRYLGGTNHTDPIGYFSQYGYSWTQFTWLVQAKYRDIASQDVQQTALKEAKTSKLGQIKSKDAVIYKSPDTDEGSFKAGTTYTDRTYFIKQQATLNGETFYKISNSASATKNVVGWVNSKDVKAYAHKGVDRVAKVFYVKGKVVAYNRAWGAKKNLVFNDYDHQDQLFEVNLTEKVGNNVWYRGMLDGQQVWIHSSWVEPGDGSNHEHKTSRLGHIKNGSVKIYATPGVDKTALTAGTKYTNQVYYIKKQAYKDKTQYYLLTTRASASKGLVGWVRASDLTTHSHLGVDRESKEKKLLGKGVAYNKAWGGKKNLVYSDLSGFKGATLYVNLTESVGKNIWYRGTLNGKTVWIHSSHIQ
ncbi:N-acetylmuramoyl-L-alanine amidase [Aciduricibacillus chroicocephali]|uniref:Autolysin n=1 Tax=Aciduricibacillus chroicocephali TaxID=3054939 RepID=A0ABY9KUD9_9BACI|nr:N-acetylmuramoyl-L-alanine amidase [Bacillaceae bacterium 44XB]